MRTLLRARFRVRGAIPSARPGTPRIRRQTFTEVSEIKNSVEGAVVLLSSCRR